jgi:hypothetical protein
VQENIAFGNLKAQFFPNHHFKKALPVVELGHQANDFCNNYKKCILCDNK